MDASLDGPLAAAAPSAAASRAGTPDLTAPATFRHWVPEHVRFADLDPVGHANNNAIGVYFESGRLGLHAALGLRGLIGDGVVVLRHLAMDYRAEVHYPNDLRIGVGILRVGTTSWTSGAGLFIGDRCHATSEAVTVLIDRHSRRPVPLPDALRAALAANLL